VLASNEKEETLYFFEDVFIITHISESGKFQTYELIISKRVSRTSYIYICYIFVWSVGLLLVIIVGGLYQSLEIWIS